MNTKQAIRKALESIMSENEAMACTIFKGWEHDGQNQNYGWHYTQFGRQAIYLGANKTEALATIEQIAEYRAELA